MTAPARKFRQLRLARLIGVILFSAPLAACHLLAPSRTVAVPPPPPPPPTVSPPTGSELPTCPGDPRCDRAQAQSVVGDVKD